MVSAVPLIVDEIDEIAGRGCFCSHRGAGPPKANHGAVALLSTIDGDVFPSQSVDEHPGRRVWGGAPACELFNKPLCQTDPPARSADFKSGAGEVIDFPGHSMTKFESADMFCVVS